MHPLFGKADGHTGSVIGAAIEVHRIMGSGLLESIYERCLLRKLELRSIPVLNQEEVVIDYKGTVFKETLKFDLLVDGCLLVELKAIHEVRPIHQAQIDELHEIAKCPSRAPAQFQCSQAGRRNLQAHPAQCKRALNRRAK